MKRANLTKLVGVLLLVGASQTSHPYEIDTHATLSEEAAIASNLTEDAAIFLNLGIRSSDKFPNSKNEMKTFVRLIGDGARFEDKVLPYPRVVNHFYNPLSSKGLGVDLTVLGHPSPDWALEDRGEITGVLGFGEQEYSYRDGREFFYRALTGRDATGTVIAATKSERDKNFGLAFQTLGQVIHHIQDMAQPQHVRDDGHLGLNSSQTSLLCLASPALCVGYFAIKDPSTYESWTNRYDVRENLPIDFSLAGYDIGSPKFTSVFGQPRDFWETTNGEGLAQFTNRNFVSAGTNFENAGMFNFPLFTPSLHVDMDIEQLCKIAKPPCSLKGDEKVQFYGNWVEDRFTGQKILNPLASTYSVYDADLERIGAKKVFTLNQFNFATAHGFLIPRAVAYSAGLINYFFRGRMEFKADPNNPGKYIIQNLGPEDMKGTFTLYYDAKDGKRYPVAGDMAGETWVNRSVAAKGELTNLGFTPPVEPAPKSPGVYMLVFNGDMGEEKAISGSTVGAVVATRAQPPSRIAFLLPSGPYTGRDRFDVFVVSPDGSNLRNVTNMPGEYDDIAWSPDGTRIAFSSNRDGADEIYVVNVDSGELMNVSNTPGNDSSPTWSPDGMKIAFRNYSNGNSEIMIVGADGAFIKNLTNTPEDGEWDPVWSPSGSDIVIDGYFEGLYELAVIDAVSGVRRRLTASPEGDKYDYYPRWSPDGEKIVFESRRDGNYEIYVMSAKGDSVTRLTYNSASDLFPRWSPDGSQIAFVNSNDGNDKIHVIKPDGSGETLLTNNPDTVSDWHPTWSPSGEKIAFVTNRSSRRIEIYIMNADGSNQMFLTRGSWPIWSPGKANTD